MTIRARSLLCSALVCAGLCMPLATHAQTLGLDLGSNGGAFSMSLSPQNPSPNSQATLTFLSTALSLANATVAVYENGSSIYKGSVQPVSVPLGTAGKTVTIKAVVTEQGKSYTQTLSVQPQDVALVAEPVSSAPPLYPGEPGVPLNGSVRVVAMANLKNAAGTVIDPAKLSYQWKIGSQSLPNNSGIGQNTLLVASPKEYRDETVSVTVQSQDGSLVGGNFITISPVQPVVRLYVQDPLLGIRFDRALTGSYTLNGPETTLYAAAFSFETTNNNLALQWFMNGSSAQTGPTITLRPTGRGTGTAHISVTGSTGTLDTTASSLNLSFGTTTGTNLLGL